MRGKTVLTCGCFDILHIGHVLYLKAAKSFGDKLIVAVNSDESFVSNKHRKPFVCQEERAEIIASLEFVDECFIFDGITASGEIARIRPDIFVKGADWKGLEFEERSAIKLAGGKMMFAPITQNRSTTLLINKIRQS